MERDLTLREASLKETCRELIYLFRRHIDPLDPTISLQKMIGVFATIGSIEIDEAAKIFFVVSEEENAKLP